MDESFVPNQSQNQNKTMGSSSPNSHMFVTSSVGNVTTSNSNTSTHSQASLLSPPSQQQHQIAVSIPPSSQGFELTQQLDDQFTQTQQQYQQQQGIDNEEYGLITPLDRLGESSAPVEIRNESRCTIGRLKTSDIHIPVGTISSKHCSVYMENRSFLVIDHGSSNGTYINRKSQRLEPNVPCVLKHGDIIYLAVPHDLSIKLGRKQSYLHNSNAPSPNRYGTSRSAEKSQPRAEGFKLLFQVHQFPQQLSQPPQNIQQSEAVRTRSSSITSKFSPARSMYDDAISLALKGKYKVERELGRGSFATVVKATTLDSHEPVAIKMIAKRQFAMNDPYRWVQQLNEVDILKKLSGHPRIVHYIGSFMSKDDSYLFIVTEFIAGGELFDHLLSFGAYPEEKAKLLIWNILDALSFIHDKGFVHRDLKPENILLTRNDKYCTDCKLIDFGVTKEECGGRATFCGSMTYVAPEVLKRKDTILGNGKYTKSVDIWSLGVCTYIVLTVIPPFDDQDDSFMHNVIDDVLAFQGKEWQSISPVAKDFITKCLQVSESKRINVHDALKHPWFASVVQFAQPKIQPKSQDASVKRNIMQPIRDTIINLE